MVQQGHYGELSSILGAIPTHQQLATAEAPEAEDEPEQKEPVKKLGAEEEEDEEAGQEEEEEGDGGEDEEEEEEGATRQQDGASAAAQQQPDEQRQRPRPHRMQTFVFSATLTLPANLRKRLRKGGGGASGSSDLDGLMDKIPFRWGPGLQRCWLLSPSVPCSPASQTQPDPATVPHRAGGPGFSAP